MSSNRAEWVLGVLWVVSIYAWGIFVTGMLLFAPLLVANLLGSIFDDMRATAAMALGVVGAYAIGLPPWDADEPISFPLVLGGTAASVVAWDLLRGGADAFTLLVALALVALGWPIRRAISRRGSLQQSGQGDTAA